MIKSIEIKNYKNLSRFSIHNFSQVNLISGKNNVGKSTLLEAIAIFEDDSVLPYILDILEARGEYLIRKFFRNEPKSRNEIIKQNIDVFSSLFTGRNFKISQENKILISSEDRFLQICFINYIEQKNEYGFIKPIIIPELNDSYELMDLNVALQIKNNETDYLLPLDKKIETSRYGRINRNETNDLIIINPNNNNYSQNNSILWDKITLTNKEQFVIKALQIIDPNIENIAFVESTLDRDRYPVVKIKNSEKRIPLKSMGDGINHILTIILALVNCQGCLLIDEIDNGLHYSVQKQVWEIIFELSAKLDIQVFATTHSSDCIRSFGKVMNQNPNRKKGSYYRLEYKNGKIQAINYNGEELEIVAVQNIEVR